MQRRLLFLDKNNRYYIKQSEFNKIKGMPYTSYWASESILKAFENSCSVGDVSDPRVGMATANNDRFIRLWFEVDNNKFFCDCPNRDIAKTSTVKNN